MTTHLTGEAAANANANALLVGRLERIPVTKRLLWIRVIIGSATFFDAYTVLVIAFAMPSLVEEWSLTPAWVGLILSAGYLGQLIDERVLLTDVWVRNDGGDWQVVRRHSSPVPAGTCIG